VCLAELTPLAKYSSCPHLQKAVLHIGFATFPSERGFGVC
jgi:hypothetical protein